ncbi:MAG: hypothetical protein ACE37F_11065 [Nannocystaceae bacterium]|nr:hypothetical protein [bacterium]
MSEDTTARPLLEFDAVDSILDLLCEATGQRIALVAEVTPDQWRCHAVRDHAGFGLQRGDALDVQTTF